MLELLAYVAQNPEGELTLQQAGALMVFLAELGPSEHAEVIERGAAVALYTVMARAQMSVDALVIEGCDQGWSMAA